METEIIDGFAEGEAERAGRLIRDGALVAFPTETVYGLGANACDRDAVRRVYEVKGRPARNPLILHVATAEDARELATSWNERAEALAATFWPGPLTLVLPAAPAVAAEALGGGDTMGLRVPAHPIAKRLLRAAGVPVAAPSANPSGRLSPTHPEVVEGYLLGRIEAIVRGGPALVGLESTVLDATEDPVRLLRPGMIGRDMIEAVLGRPVVTAEGNAGTGERLRSPGQMARHYAPAIPLALVAQPSGEGAFAIRLGEAFELADRSITLPLSPGPYAASLYWALWRAEQSGAARIEVERPPEAPAWQAIHDRLNRAST